MASGQMNFNMRFTADTSQAQSAIQQLQTSLSQIAMAGSGAGVSKGMTEAASAAKELSYHLNQAYNATTGNFDLSRLDKSLRTSNTNVTKLSSSLLQAGQSGQQAFIQLAQSIASADRPMINLSSRMTDLFTTIKNTAKWQISSSIIHGFMGAVQQAYGYAQDLNESLNNIRIVTGYNTEQMAAFAEKANKAAKALSTTTTAYTDAALIYYQQGLAESEIEERTAVTVKMANVSGQNAEEVSDQMTAVWNNFYDGSKSLEYYADVMTKLGAATASSSDEIAQGLEKFAAVSETVGLSYEYATAALATVTAETRQSADVVGTAFKTLFARIQGLKLGETLEDGTDLNQYSEALMAVGVDIKDTNGELKDMDTILNEMAAVWRTLNKDEQTALAQKVAGIRQYTQLIALMENWDVMEQNLGFVEMSEGSLQEQQDIYEESWKAASDRVRASMESIYSDLLDDEFFIDLTNGFSSLIDSLDAFIDGFGGVKMIVTSVASILMATFAHKVPAALENLKANFNVVFKGAVTQAQELSNKMVETTNQVLNNKGINLSASDRQVLESANQLNIAKNRLLEVEGKLTPLEKQRYQTELLILQAQQEEVQASVQDNENKKKALNLAEQELQIAREEVKINETKNFDEEKAESIVEKDRGGIEQALRDDYLRRRDAYQTNMSSENLHALKESETALFSFANNSERARGIFDNFLNTLKNGYDMEMRLNQGNIELSSSTLAVGNAFADYTSDLTNLQASLNNGEISFKQVKNSMIDLESQLKLASGGIIDFSKEFAKIQTAGNNKQLSSAIDELIKKITSAQIPAKDLEKVLNKLGQNKYTKNAVQGYDELRQKIQQVQNKSKEYQQSLEQTKKKQQELNSFMSNFNPTHVVTGIERVTQAAAGLGQTAMLIQSFRSLIEAWNNDDLTFGEKLTTSFMSISMIVPSAMGAIRSFNTVLSAGDKTLLGQIALRRTSNALMQQEVAQTITNAATQQMANIIKNEGQQIDEKTIQAGIKRMLASKGIENANLREILSLQILNKAKKNNKIATEGETVASGKLTLARIIENAASQSLLTTLGQLMVLLWPYLAIMAALAIAITGVVLVVNALSDAYNADAIAAEQAKKTAQELAEQYDYIKEKYENMVAAMTKYKEATDALKKLAEGTDEYKEALEAANRAALELIQNNPGKFTSSDYSYNDQGQLIINEDAQKRVLNDLKNQEQAAYTAKSMGQARADVAQAESDKTDLKRSIRDEAGYGDSDIMWARAAEGMAASSGQPVNTAASDAMQDIANQYDAAVDKIISAYQDNPNILSGDLEAFSSQMADLGITNEDLIQALFENQGELQTLGNQTLSAADTYKLATEEAVRHLLGEDVEEDTKESGDYDKIVAKTGEMYDKEYQKQLDDLSGWGNNVSQWDGRTSKEAKAIWKEYAKAAGLEDATLTDVIGNDGNRAYEYQINGEDKSVDMETMREVVAAYKANNNIKADAESLTQIIESLNAYLEQDRDNNEGKQSDSGNMTAAIKDFILTNDFSGASKETISNLQSVFGEEDIEARRQKIQETLTTMLAQEGESFEELATRLGYDSGTALIDSFSNTLNEADINWDSLKPPVEMVGQEGLSTDAINNLTGIYSSANEVGSGNGDQVMQNLNDIVNTIDVENQTAAMEALAGIDWSSWNASEQALEALYGLGITSDETTEKVEGLSESMRDLNGATKDLDDLKTALDSDVDVEEYENLAEHLREVAESSEDLSDELKYNDKAAKKTAEAILRFDKAIQKVDKNYEDWSKTLKSGSLQDQAKLVDDLGDAYADMLDIDMGSLSKDFILNADNLELMKQAAEGSEEAYQQLQQAAQQDILAQCDLDTTAFDAAKTALDAELAELDFKNLEIGASLNSADALAAMTDLVNAAGMTAQQATDYLATMGVDATVKTVEKEEEEKHKYAGAEANVTTQEVTGVDPLTGGEVTYSIPSVTYTEKPLETTGEKQTKATALEVTSANKSSGGGFKFENSNSGGSTGGGGGGGGSESKPAKKIKRTHKSDVVERYKKINDAIDDMTDALEKANMETDRMFGQARIKGMEKVNQLTRQEIGLLKQKASEAKKYTDQDKIDLQQAAAENGLGQFKFDDMGNITNYESQMTQLFNELAAAEAHQDSLSTQEEQDEYQETVDKINDRIDAVKEAMERYEESREELEELEKQIREKEIEIEDRELEIFMYEVELKINVDQHQLDYLEYLLEEMENLAFKSAERINDIFAEQAELYANQAKTTRKAIRDLLKLSKEDLTLYDDGKYDKIDWSKYTENFTEADEMKDLEELTQNLLDQNSSLMEIRRLVHEELIVTFEEWNEELDRNTSYIEHYGTMVEHLQNIADLTKAFTGTDAKFLDELAKAKVAVAQDKAAAAKATYDANVTALADAQAALDQAKKDYKKGKISEEELKMWEDTVNQMQEAVYESEDELYSAVSEVVEAAAERYEQAMDQAFKTFEKQIAGQAGSLEELSNQMDRAKQTSEHYLKDYQKIYELTKLNRKITDSIDESSNVKAKQALRDLQKEINEYQKESNEMSQYDLDYLQKKYDLKLAQIALEEAREAKNQVRLTRDAEGNYGYTYTADQENVDNAQQNYEDKLYELQSLSDNYLTELQDNILSTQQEYSDALREIYERQKEGYYESEAAFQEALAQVNEHYTGHLEYLYDEMDKACGNNAKLYESDWSTYNGFVSGKINDNIEFITSFGQTMLGMQTGFTDTETAMKIFKDAIGTATDDGKGTGLLGTMNQAFASFKKSTTKALKNIGIEGLGALQTDFKNKIGSDSKKDSILGKSNTAKKEILKDAEAMIGNAKEGTGIKGVIASIQDWEKEHSKAIQKIINKNKLAIQAYNSLYKAAALGTEKKNNNDDDDKKNPDPPKNNPDPNKKGDGKPAVGDEVVFESGSYYYDSYGTSPLGNRGHGKKAKITHMNPGAPYPIHLESKDSAFGWVKQSQISGYDTGGYTGEWGPEGKLALLHEKELILNKNDTANLLSTIEMVRELSDLLDIYAQQASLGLQILEVAKLQSTEQSLQQEVTIRAEFPGVSDRNEIEAAFDNLINRASQFAYRNR